MYHVQCAECGWESDMQKSDAKRVSECRHRAMLNQEQIDIWYKKNKKQCLHCGKDMPLNDLGFGEYKERKFCSSSCAASYINKFTKKKEYDNYCPNCGKKIESRNKYCSSQCQADFQYKLYIERWKNGLEDGIKGMYSISSYIRRYLIEKYDGKCSQCGWSKTNPYTGKVPLEVHHKDGDYTNNDESNLDLLCPNCHSLTATYKASNLGNGRKERKKYQSQYKINGWQTFKLPLHLP
jgi:Zn finger protein HypA/HybF involved in hydrogenase expression